MIVTYSTIASQFYKLSDGHWLLVAYNMGFCYSLPIVSGIKGFHDFVSINVAHVDSSFVGRFCISMEI